MTDIGELLRDEHLESLAFPVERNQLTSATRATYVIHQDLCYSYDRPVTRLRQQLVVVPRIRHGDQRRIAHRFEVGSCSGSQVDQRTDQFGNSVVEVVAPNVNNRIEFKAHAVVTRTMGAGEPAAWLTPRPAVTTLTTPDDHLRESAADQRVGDDTSATAEAVADFIHRSFQYQHDVTSVRTTAAEAWQIRQGVCQDMAHVMITMCSTLDIAARYVSGHLVGDGASHAWVEVFDAARATVVAIDPTHARRTDLRYVTTATGRDYRDVAPTAGTFVGNGANGRLTVRKRIRLVDVA